MYWCSSPADLNSKAFKRKKRGRKEKKEANKIYKGFMQMAYWHGKETKTSKWQARIFCGNNSESEKRMTSVPFGICEKARWYS